MNEQIQQKLLQYLNSIESFTKEQVPSFVNEILTYNYYCSLIWLITSLVLIPLFVFVVYLCFKYNKKHSHIYFNNPLTEVFVPAVSIFVLIVLLVGSIDSGVTLIQIKYAPKLYLMKQIKILSK